MAAPPDLKSIFAKVKQLAAQSEPAKSPRADASAPASKRAKVQSSQEDGDLKSSPRGTGEPADDGSSKRPRALAAPRDVHRERVRLANAVEAMPGGNCVVYWMSRDQRVRDNWALLEASRLARASGVALRVVFCLVPRFLDATIRHFLPSLYFCNILRHDLPPPSGTSGSCAAA